ncbi:MAG: translation initiation factor IF-2 [bacterium]|nr:translation initiation factor IF-2 [bacterium]
MSVAKLQTTNDKLQTSPRPPVVVVLGHVDHGKTSILDKIRQAKVAQGEAGGITQHIGAYQAEHNGKKITFLDTPGHEAFSAIRSRGAKVADVAVMVVAADEGVKPQTKEVIEILKETKTPFVVAINKIDSQGANAQAVRQGLAEQEVLVEDYGGKVPVVELSAKTGQGIDELLEMILLIAEVEDLKSRMEGLAEGTVIEVHLDKQRGMVATLLVREGELSVGDWVVAGSGLARVKLLEDFSGKRVDTAISSQPVVALGWSNPPKVGEQFKTYKSAKEAEAVSVANSNIGPAVIFQVESGPEVTNKKISNIVLKADTQSSLEALDHAMKTIHSEEVGYRVVFYGVGNVGDNDVRKAVAGQAAVIGFNVAIDGSAANLAERNGVSIKTFNIIYGLIEEVRSIMSELLEPEIKRTDLGKLKVLAVFKKDAKSQVVGGKITSGKAVRGATVDIVRNGSAVLTGRLGQLQHNKADVAEVAEGLECGMRIDLPKEQIRPIFIQEGDVLQIYEEEEIKRSL